VPAKPQLPAPESQTAPAPSVAENPVPSAEPLPQHELEPAATEHAAPRPLPGNVLTASVLPGGALPKYAVGSMTVAEAGILARIGWIAHVKNLYAAIPAYESAGASMSMSVSALVPAWAVPRRKRSKIPPALS
jgi:hypothetical protein